MSFTKITCIVVSLIINIHSTTVVELAFNENYSEIVSKSQNIPLGVKEFLIEIKANNENNPVINILNPKDKSTGEDIELQQFKNKSKDSITYKFVLKKINSCSYLNIEIDLEIQIPNKGEKSTIKESLEIFVQCVVIFISDDEKPKFIEANDNPIHFELNFILLPLANVLKKHTFTDIKLLKEENIANDEERDMIAEINEIETEIDENSKVKVHFLLPNTNSNKKIQIEKEENVIIYSKGKDDQNASWKTNLFQISIELNDMEKQNLGNLEIVLNILNNDDNEKEIEEGKIPTNYEFEKKFYYLKYYLFKALKKNEEEESIQLLSFNNNLLAQAVNKMDENTFLSFVKKRILKEGSFNLSDLILYLENLYIYIKQKSFKVFVSPGKIASLKDQFYFLDKKLESFLNQNSSDDENISYLLNSLSDSMKNSKYKGILKTPSFFLNLHFSKDNIGESEEDLIPSKKDKSDLPVDKSEGAEGKRKEAEKMGEEGEEEEKSKSFFIESVIIDRYIKKEFSTIENIINDSFEFSKFGLKNNSFKKIGTSSGNFKSINFFEGYNFYSNSISKFEMEDLKEIYLKNFLFVYDFNIKILMENSNSFNDFNVESNYHSLNDSKNLLENFNPSPKIIPKLNISINRVLIDVFEMGFSISLKDFIKQNKINEESEGKKAEGDESSKVETKFSIEINLRIYDDDLDNEILSNDLEDISLIYSKWTEIISGEEEENKKRKFEESFLKSGNFSFHLSTEDNLTFFSKVFLIIKNEDLLRINELIIIPEIKIFKNEEEEKEGNIDIKITSSLSTSKSVKKITNQNFDFIVKNGSIDENIKNHYKKENKLIRIKNNFNINCSEIDLFIDMNYGRNRKDKIDEENEESLKNKKFKLLINYFFMDEQFNNTFINDSLHKKPLSLNLEMKDQLNIGNENKKDLETFSAAMKTFSNSTFIFPFFTIENFDQSKNKTKEKETDKEKEDVEIDPKLRILRAFQNAFLYEFDGKEKETFNFYLKNEIFNETVSEKDEEGKKKEEADSDPNPFKSNINFDEIVLNELGNKNRIKEIEINKEGNSSINLILNSIEILKANGTNSNDIKFKYNFKNILEYILITANGNESSNNLKEIEENSKFLINSMLFINFYQKGMNSIKINNRKEFSDNYSFIISNISKLSNFFKTIFSNHSNFGEKYYKNVSNGENYFLSICSEPIYSFDESLTNFDFLFAHLNKLTLNSSLNNSSNSNDEGKLLESNNILKKSEILKMQFSFETFIFKIDKQKLKELLADDENYFVEAENEINKKDLIYDEQKEIAKINLMEKSILTFPFENNFLVYNNFFFKIKSILKIILENINLYFKEPSIYKENINVVEGIEKLIIEGSEEEEEEKRIWKELYNQKISKIKEFKLHEIKRVLLMVNNLQILNKKAIYLFEKIFVLLEPNYTKNSIFNKEEFEKIIDIKLKEISELKEEKEEEEIIKNIMEEIVNKATLMFTYNFNKPLIMSEFSSFQKMILNFFNPFETLVRKFNNLKERIDEEDAEKVKINKEIIENTNYFKSKLRKMLTFLPFDSEKVSFDVPFNSTDYHQRQNLYEISSKRFNEIKKINNKSFFEVDLYSFFGLFLFPSLEDNKMLFLLESKLVSTKNDNAMKSIVLLNSFSSKNEEFDNFSKMFENENDIKEGKERIKDYTELLFHYTHKELYLYPCLFEVSKELFKLYEFSFFDKYEIYDLKFNFKKIIKNIILARDDEKEFNEKLDINFSNEEIELMNFVLNDEGKLNLNTSNFDKNFKVQEKDLYKISLNPQIGDGDSDLSSSSNLVPRKLSFVEAFLSFKLRRTFLKKEEEEEEFIEETEEKELRLNLNINLKYYFNVRFELPKKIKIGEKLKIKTIFDYFPFNEDEYKEVLSYLLLKVKISHFSSSGTDNKLSNKNTEINHSLDLTLCEGKDGKKLSYSEIISNVKKAMNDGKENKENEICFVSFIDENKIIFNDRVKNLEVNLNLTYLQADKNLLEMRNLFLKYKERNFKLKVEPLNFELLEKEIKLRNFGFIFMVSFCSLLILITLLIFILIGLFFKQKIFDYVKREKDRRKRQEELFFYESQL